MRGGVSLILGQAAKILHAAQCSQKNKQTKTTPSLHSPNFEVGCSPPASAAASHRRNLILQESSGEGLGGK